jgi:hypothetical protein
MRRIAKPCMQAAAQLAHKPVELLSPSDFAMIYLSRDWYFILFDYINDRIDNTSDKATVMEVFEMQRVWLLQCFYQTTATKLFKCASE